MTTGIRSPSLNCTSTTRRTRESISSCTSMPDVVDETTGSYQHSGGGGGGRRSSASDHGIDSVDSMSTDGTTGDRPRQFVGNKRLTFVNFCLTNLCVGCFYSLLGPFFPKEAARKGVSSTLTGLIFGIFELTIVVSSPVFGSILPHVGAKFMYVSGVLVCGSGAVLFGFLDDSPDGAVYVVMCFLVRVVEALGAAALATASFATIASTFPDALASMLGTLELFVGMGLMIGPTVGGALFELGGFKLPFFVLGGIMIVVGFVTIFLLPSQNVIMLRSEQSFYSLLFIPVVPVMGFLLMSGSGSIGFLDVTLSIFLTDHYHLTPVYLGLVFLTACGSYAIMAPVWGKIVDKAPRFNKIIMCSGYMLAGYSFYLMGPAPFLPIPPSLELTIASCVMMGFGMGTQVIAFQIISEATKAAGYPDDLGTYGLVAGLFNSFYSLGAFLGPIAGGYLHDTLEFELAAVVIGSISMFAACILFIYILVDKYWCNNSDVVSDENVVASERDPLLANGGDVLRPRYTDENLTNNGVHLRPEFYSSS